MKTLIALLALVLLVVPMLAGIGRLRRVPRRTDGAGPSPQRGPSAHNGEDGEQLGLGARSLDVPSRHERQGSPEMTNQSNDDRNRQQGGGDRDRQQQQQQSDSDRNRQQGGGMDRDRQQQQQQSDSDRNRQQGGDRDRDRDDNRQQG